MATANRLNLQHLAYLEALVLERHVTRAADRVGIGQPAMSTALAKLRLLFKDPLLVKTSSGMEPTPRALELAKRIREMMDLLSGSDSAGQAFEPGVAEGHYRLMASDGISLLLLPELMRRIRARAPRMRMTFGPGDIRRMSEYLRDGESDLVVAFVRRPPQELHQALLYSQNLVCIANARHPDIRERMSLKQFVAHSHVVWGAPPVPYPTMEVMVDKALEQLGLSRNVGLRVSNVMLSAAVVSTTDMLAVVPERVALASRGTSSIQVLALPFKVDRVDVSMFWHERWHRDPAHSWLRAVLREVGEVLAARLPKVSDA